MSPVLLNPQLLLHLHWGKVGTVNLKARGLPVFPFFGPKMCGIFYHRMIGMICICWAMSVVPQNSRLRRWIFWHSFDSQPIEPSSCGETTHIMRQAEGSQSAQCDGAQFENQETIGFWRWAIPGCELRSSPWRIPSATGKWRINLYTYGKSPLNISKYRGFQKWGIPKIDGLVHGTSH